MKKLRPAGFLEKRCFGSRLDGSSRAWFKRQTSDPYVTAAMKASYRSRAAFKLIEIDDKHKFLKPGSTVLDLGAAPGSWSQVAAERTNALGQIKSGKIGQVIAVDLNPFEEIDGVLTIPESDFTQGLTQKTILEILRGHPLNIVLSDMAPNATGAKDGDHLNIVRLFIAAYGFAIQHLASGGLFLGKLWDGGEKSRILKMASEHFTTVKVVKPPASRDESSECFVLAMHLRRRPKLN